MQFVAILLACAIGAAPAPAITPGPNITPDTGSENPVAVGALATLRIEGLKDPSLGRATVWPEADLLPVLLSGSANGSWRVWGSMPALQFRASRTGQYRVLLLEEADGQDHAAEYIVEVGDPPPPPVLVVEPPDPFFSAGATGGPFSPAEQRYTISSSRPDWTADVGDADWVSVLKGSGYVRVQITPAADGLAEGVYEAALNVRLGELSETRAVRLTISSEPPPPPPPTELWAIVVEESEDRTAKQAVVLLSPEVRAAFDEFKLIDDDQKVSADLQGYLDRAAGKPLPHLCVVGDNGHVYYEGELPATEQAMIDLANQHKTGGME